MIPQRTLSRIHRKQQFGSDQQVDDRAVVMLPDDAPGVAIDAHAGTIGETSGAAAMNSPLPGIVVTLDPLASCDLPVPGEHRLFVVVLDGRALIGGHELTAGQIGWSDPIGGPAGASSLHLAAPDGHSPARLVVYSPELDWSPPRGEVR